MLLGFILSYTRDWLAFEHKSEHLSSANRSPLLDVDLPKLAPPNPILCNPHPTPIGNFSQAVSPVDWKSYYNTFAETRFPV